MTTVAEAIGGGLACAILLGTFGGQGDRSGFSFLGRVGSVTLESTGLFPKEGGLRLKDAVERGRN